MFISPMLLETAKEPFNSDSHIFEPKIDGHRMIYSQEGDEVRLYTRNGNEVTEKYPELIGGVEGDILIDGEVALTDPESGQISFEALSDRFRLQRKDPIAAAAAAHPVNFVAFDVLRYQGKDLRHLPLMRRKEILTEVALGGNPNLSVIPFVECRGVNLFRTIQEQGMEGMVAKERDSRYATGRRVQKWQKVINWQYVDVVITGYKKSEFGWMAAIEDGDELRPAGFIELGVKPVHKKAFYAVCKSIESGFYRDIVHLEPVLRAKVKTRNLTRTGKLRDAVFVDFIA